MARRLVLARQPGSDSHILPNVPAPPRVPAGACALMAALQAALNYVGRAASYDTLMGLTGLAFGLPGCQPPRLREALAALGFAGDLCPGPTNPQALSALKAALHAGFPVAVVGWPTPQDDWGLIAGYDRGGAILCGWPAGAAGPAYLGAPAAGSALIVLAGPVSPLDPADAARAALSWAAAQYDPLRQGYQEWSAELANGMEQRSDDASDALRHAARLATLADARTAAAGYLEECAELFDEVAAAWLLRARDAYQLLVDRAEADPLLRDGPVSDALRAWLDTAPQELADITRLDLAALQDVQRALTLPYGPDEMVD